MHFKPVSTASKVMKVVPKTTNNETKCRKIEFRRLRKVRFCIHSDVKCLFFELHHQIQLREQSQRKPGNKHRSNTNFAPKCRASFENGLRNIPEIVPNPTLGPNVSLLLLSWPSRVPTSCQHFPPMVPKWNDRACQMTD